ncbi:MAG TPA: AsmA family protein [Steroidobacteraceae bacterium]|nr:AsmA family protein [Steroidobacteraceae bacterium]
MRALKILGIAIGALVALLVLALLAVRLFVDPNAYKGRIEAAVKDSTGRELTLGGPIRLSVFPWIALELGPASLGNPPGFSSEPFAAVEHVALRVKLLPLLHKELQIGRIEIDGLDLRLHKNAAGKGNWQDFGGKGAASTPASSSSSPTALPVLAGVVIKNSHVAYEDLSVDHLNFELGHLSAGEPAPVKLQLTLTPSRTAQPIDLTGRFNIILNTAKQQYGANALELGGTLKPAANATAIPWKFSVPNLGVDLAAQTLTAPSFAVQLAAARLDGALKGIRIIDAPMVTGSFKLDPISLRDLMTRLGMEAPKTRDPKVLSKLAGKGDFSYGGNALATSGLDIQLDDSRLRGKAALTSLDTKAMSFNLAIDRIDVDRYRSPETAAPAPKPASKEDTSSPSALKTLRMDGTLTIGSVTISNLSLTQLLVTIAAKDGVTHIAPAKAKLYGGDYSGDITLDERGATPSLKIDQSMTNVDLAPLMKDFAKSQRISGHGTVTANLTAHGLAGDALFKTLNGHVAANVDNGAVEGVDLWFEINRALALVQKQSLPSGQSTGRTKFDAFKASADINNGVATTKDLNITSQNLHVTGQGTTNLVTNAINYQVKATILKEAPGAAGASGKTLADIPLNITGTTNSPSVRPDLEVLAKARIQQELDKHKGELQQKLMDKLKGVFK